MPSRYERALARTDAESRRRMMKHALPPTDDPNNLDALCPAAAPSRSTQTNGALPGGRQSETNARVPGGCVISRDKAVATAPTPARIKEGRLPALDVKDACARSRVLQRPPRRGTKGRRSAPRNDQASEVRATPTVPDRAGCGGDEPGAEPSSSGEWSSIVRAKPRRRTGRSRRSVEAAESERNSTTPPPEESLVSSSECVERQLNLSQRGKHRRSCAPTLQVGTDNADVDASSSGEWASLVEVKRQIDFRESRGNFSPPVTPASELREGSAEDFDAAEQAEWRDTALPKVGGARRAVEWRTDVVDIQAQLDSLESLPYSLNELKLDASVCVENPAAEVWHVADEER